MNNFPSHNEIENLNAHGPYDHGLWNEIVTDSSTANNDKSINGGIFHERSRHLVKNISKIISSHYSEEEISQLSVVDIGCYDGWILVQLAKLFKFKSAVGVEPRLKNIQKGKFARDFYKITSNVKFLQSDIDSLEKVIGFEKFDIVLCLGVLHHVESTTDAIRRLSNISKHMLIIDSMVIDKPKKDEGKILRLLNLRDIAYIDGPQHWAIAAFKYETPYFDGSTSGVPIVNVPEERLIRMSLDTFGFSVEHAHHPDETAFKKAFQKVRGVRETFIVATREQDHLVESIHTSVKTKSAIHETTFIFAEIPPQMLGRWLKGVGIDFDLPNQDESPKNRVKHSLIYHASRNPTSRISRMLLKSAKLTPGAHAIVVNLSRSPLDKTQFEFGKYYLKRGDLSNAKLAFKKITSKHGCDWRVFYRSCFFLTVIARIENDNVAFVHYQQLLDIANPHFPISTTEGVEWVVKAN